MAGENRRPGVRTSLGSEPPEPRVGGRGATVVRVPFPDPSDRKPGQASWGAAREEPLRGPNMRPKVDAAKPPPEVLGARTADGSWNDLADPTMGAKGTGFGRNVPLPRPGRSQAAARPQPAGHQREADGARHVQAGRHHQRPRRGLAAVREPQLVLPRQRAARGRHRDPAARRRRLAGEPDADPGTHHPDARRRSRRRPRAAATPTPRRTGGTARRSTAAGADKQNEVRTFVDGKIKVDDDGRLPHERHPRRRPHRHDARTGGSGTRPAAHPVRPRAQRRLRRAEEGLPGASTTSGCSRSAWLVIAALIAKIHTVEWTPCVLRHPALQIGMNANWYGALGRDVQGQASAGSATARPSAASSGSPTDHHTRAVLADRGVRLGLPHAPADPGRLDVLLRWRRGELPARRLLHRHPGPVHPRLHGPA